MSVVIPALDEEENLPYVLPGIPEDLHEIILVDDHSTDATAAVAKSLRPDVITVPNHRPRGKGNAMATGVETATGDVVVFLDADGSSDPGEIPSFVAALLDGADYAKGTRFAGRGGTADMPWHRKAGNRVLTALVRAVYGGSYTDLCYGYNALWRDVALSMALETDGFEIETLMNIRALQLGLRVTEVPSFEAERVHGVGRLRTLPDGWRVVKTIWAERARRPSRVSVVAAPVEGGL